MADTHILLLCCGGRVAEYCMCLSVCLSVCSRAYLWNHWTDLHTDSMWLWLSPPLMALWYTLCNFGFYGWRHVVGCMALAALQHQGRIWCLWMPCFHMKFISLLKSTNEVRHFCTEFFSAWVYGWFLTCWQVGMMRVKMKPAGWKASYGWFLTCWQVGMMRVKMKPAGWKASRSCSPWSSSCWWRRSMTGARSDSSAVCRARLSMNTSLRHCAAAKWFRFLSATSSSATSVKLNMVSTRVSAISHFVIRGNSFYSMPLCCVLGNRP